MDELSAPGSQGGILRPVGDEVVAEYDVDDYLINQYITANGERIARLQVSALGGMDTLYLHHDRQGSLRMVTSRIGAVAQKLYFDAFGELKTQTGASTVDYKYTGQEWDEELSLNLYYLRNRYYRALIGRFITPDPLVTDLNPYSYCNNNPVMMSDPSGLSGWWFGIKEAPTGGTAGPVRFGSGVGTARTRSGVATWGNGGWVDPETRTINNGGRGRGATDQYGNPLFAANIQSGSIHRFAILGRGIRGVPLNRPSTAVQAKFLPESCAWMSNEQSWALLGKIDEARSAGGPVSLGKILTDLVASEIESAYKDGSMPDVLYNQCLADLASGSVKFDNIKETAKHSDGMTILGMDAFAGGGRSLAGVFAHETMHHFDFMNADAAIAEVEQFINSKFLAPDFRLPDPNTCKWRMQVTYGIEMLILNGRQGYYNPQTFWNEATRVWEEVRGLGDWCP